MLDRNELWRRASMGLCLYLYEDELPEVEALAGGPQPPWIPNPGAVLAVDTVGLALKEVLSPEDEAAPPLLIRVLPARRRPA